MIVRQSVMPRGTAGPSVLEAAELSFFNPSYTWHEC